MIKAKLRLPSCVTLLELLIETYVCQLFTDTVNIWQL